MILVTHDMDIAAGDCSRIIVVADHKIAFDGTAEALFHRTENPNHGDLLIRFLLYWGEHCRGIPTAAI